LDDSQANDELPEELLTLSEVADLLQVPKEKAAMLVHWAIGRYRFGSRIITSRRLVNNFHQACEKPPANPAD
jgi:hypothetical protein